MMFETGEANPDKLVALLDLCLKGRDLMDAPEWKRYIEQSVDQPTHEPDFPHGLLFGTLVRDCERNRIGCVVGFGTTYVLIAFDEGTVEPRIVPVGAEEFTRGWYAVA